MHVHRGVGVSGRARVLGIAVHTRQQLGYLVLEGELRYICSDGGVEVRVEVPIGLLELLCEIIQHLLALFFFPGYRKYHSIFFIGADCLIKIDDFVGIITS